jgi:secreted trypsin-like serine protease
VIAGTLENGNGGTKHDVVSIIIHEDYGTDGFAHDIAVWEVRGVLIHEQFSIYLIK